MANQTTDTGKNTEVSGRSSSPGAGMGSGSGAGQNVGMANSTTGSNRSSRMSDNMTGTSRANSAAPGNSDIAFGVQSDATQASVASSTAPSSSSSTNFDRDGFANRPHSELAQSDSDSSRTSSEGSSASRSLTDTARGLVESARGMTGRLPETLTTAVAGAREQIGTKFGQLSSTVSQNVSTWPQASRNLAGKVNTQTHANPWLSVGVVGVGALILGFVLGRTTAPMADLRGYATRMGRTNIDYDDAIDE